MCKCGYAPSNGDVVTLKTKWQRIAIFNCTQKIAKGLRLLVSLVKVRTTCCLEEHKALGGTFMIVVLPNPICQVQFKVGSAIFAQQDTLKQVIPS